MWVRGKIVWAATAVPPAAIWGMAVNQIVAGSQHVRSGAEARLQGRGEAGSRAWQPSIHGALRVEPPEQ